MLLINTASAARPGSETDRSITPPRALPLVGDGGGQVAAQPVGLGGQRANRHAQVFVDGDEPASLGDRTAGVDHQMPDPGEQIGLGDRHGRRGGELAELLSTQRDPPHPRRQVHQPHDFDLPQGQGVHGELARGLRHAESGPFRSSSGLMRLRSIDVSPRAMLGKPNLKSQR
ncbi:hypothetical protein [Actinomadura sp. NBRC 104412]|uniref:hypothetical protein n=1 Tax=Actinomadura sp. NBRC 104412 TaxID=3032203 RepID=UPI002555A4D7|nr:hypothetical protein [Actinomadura sp. NBRC 104412]